MDRIASKSDHPWSARAGLLNQNYLWAPGNQYLGYTLITYTLKQSGPIRR